MYGPTAICSPSTLPVTITLEISTRCDLELRLDDLRRNAGKNACDGHHVGAASLPTRILE
jgi:hypothetical protein